ncbi:glycosyl hydrolase family 7-domain-containing protein [Dactylonectria macrodidyma]|uniref:Glucanase n=1 Tax=Dactylonectria macrodidyma TaxID=307937 RepID=A0A9P9EPN5_9HYPO|nr:glycosyl hydrolase family 7-domain-containing protein [Dactylonectria macrodidyma]
MYRTLPIASVLIAAVRAQQACSSTTETHPALTWSKCTASGCSDVDGSVVVDANWRWTHTVEGSTNCYTGNEWDTTICPDGETCASACCVDGADYSGTYGVTTSGDQLSIGFVTKGAYSTNIGSRLYLMEDETTYQMFTLLGNEFTFDVDVSGISCGLNGALYFVSMDEDGGMAKYDGNQAGAKYGTGYCDAQCARDVKFINGVANVEDWEPSDTDVNSGIGNLGTCCAEMDIWEANDISTAYTAHPCENNAQHSCEGDACGGTYSDTRYAGDCDPDGCDFNPFRQGNETFYGPGSEFTVDTTKTITVVTQFVEGSSGSLASIKRFYVQDGVVVANSESTIAGTSGNALTEEFCTAQKVAFGDEDDFTAKGGYSQMSDALASPMVLVMSLWDDHAANMLWLDSTYPVDATGDGAARGTCSTDSGVAADVEADSPNASVVFSNIKFGPIGSTFDSTGTDTESGSSSSAAATGKATSTAKAASTSAPAAVDTTSVKATSTKATSTKAASTKATVVKSSSIVPVVESTAAAIKTTSIVPVVESTAAAEEEKTTTTIKTSASTTTTTSTRAAVTTAAAVSSADDATATDDCEDEDEDDSDDTSVAAKWYQCGGKNWTGATECESGTTCTEHNEWYFQCV